MADVKQYLQDLTKQLHLRGMDMAQRAQLQFLKDKKIATKEQSSWEPGDPVPPVPVDFTDDDWKKLYQKFQDIFYDLDADKNNLKDVSGLEGFINKYYGSGKAIEKFEVNAEVANIIDGMQNPANGTPVLSVFIAGHADEFGVDTEDVNKLSTKLADGSYKTNKKALKTLAGIVQSSYFVEKFTKKPNLPASLTATNVTRSIDPIRQQLIDFVYEKADNLQRFASLDEDELGDLVEALDNGRYSDAAVIGLLNKMISSTFFKSAFEVSRIDADNRNKIIKNAQKSDQPTTEFETQFSDIISTLIKKDKIRAEFFKKDKDGEISDSIDRGLRASDYENADSKQYLNPKYAAKRTGLDKVKSAVKDFNDNHIRAWTDRTKRHVYSTNANFIVDAAVKAGVTPMTGLQSLLDKKDEIKKQIPGTAKDEFKYMVEVLEKLSKLPQFKEATQKGEQMFDIVSKIVADAVHNDKIKEARATLETLAMLRYSALTSSKRDKLKEAGKDMHFFGDKNLSWNKHEGINMVTNAIDGAIKFGAMAMFEGANLAKNAIRKRGLKYKNGDRRLKEMESNPDYRDEENRKKRDELFVFWNFVNGEQSAEWKLFRAHKKIQAEHTPKGTEFGDKNPDGTYKRKIDDIFFKYKDAFDRAA